MTGCVHTGERIGAVSVRTDASGKMASVTMKKSTGNPKTDARLMLFARTTFPARVPKARPNTNYTYPVIGDPDASYGKIRLLKPFG